MGTLFEMGIPIVGTGDQFHVSVDQKVPLSFDREQVSPAYLRDVRAAVLNAVHDRLSMDQARARPGSPTPSRTRRSRRPRCGRLWSRASASGPSPTAPGIARRMRAPLPTATTSSQVARSRGAAWGAHPGGARALRPASAVFPTPRPYSDDPDAPPVTVVPPGALHARDRGDRGVRNASWRAAPPPVHPRPSGRHAEQLRGLLRRWGTWI